MRNPQGYATIIDPGAARMVQERDTFTCAHSHCGGRVVHVKPMTDPAANGGRCLSCEDGTGRGLICSECVGKPCSPRLKAIERDEARAARLRAVVL